MLPGILTQLGPEGLNQLKRLANNVVASNKLLSSVSEEDDVPNLVENFDEISQKEAELPRKLEPSSAVEAEKKKEVINAPPAEPQSSEQTKTVEVVEKKAEPVKQAEVPVEAPKAETPKIQNPKVESPKTKPDNKKAQKKPDANQNNKKEPPKQSEKAPNPSATAPVASAEKASVPEKTAEDKKPAQPNNEPKPSQVPAEGADNKQGKSQPNANKKPNQPKGKGKQQPPKPKA